MLKTLEKKLRDIRDRAFVLPLLKTNAFRKYIPVNDHASVLDFGDHMIAFDPEDGMAWVLRKYGGWFREETMRVFDAIPGRTGAFVDVGANIGTQTIYALKFGGFDSAVCFEPHPHTAKMLRMNVALNGLSDRVTIIEAAGGAQAGTASMSLGSNSGVHSLAYRAGDKSITVPVVSVGEEMERLKKETGLAWIDVEGYEGDVLKGWPSLTAPLCIEYTPNISRLPDDTFANRKQWAEVRLDPIVWRPSSELNLASYSSQVDLLFA